MPLLGTSTWIGTIFYILALIPSSLCAFLIMFTLVHFDYKDAIDELFSGTFLEDPSGNYFFIGLTCVFSFAFCWLIQWIDQKNWFAKPSEKYFEINHHPHKQTTMFVAFQNESVNPITWFFFDAFALQVVQPQTVQIAFINKNPKDHSRFFHGLEKEVEGEAIFALLDLTPDKAMLPDYSRTGFFCVFECFDQTWAETELSSLAERELRTHLAEYMKKERDDYGFPVVPESIEQKLLKPDPARQMLLSTYIGQDALGLDHRVFRFDVWLEARCFSVQAGYPNPRHVSEALKETVCSLFGNLAVKDWNTMNHHFDPKIIKQVVERDRLLEYPIQSDNIFNLSSRTTEDSSVE